MTGELHRAMRRAALACGVFAGILGGLIALFFATHPHWKCTQTMDADLAISACSALLEGPKLSKQQQAHFYTSRAHAHHRKRDFGSSIEDHTHAVALDPENADALVRRAEVSFDLSLELVANTLPSWELAQRGMHYSRLAEDDLRKACALKRDCKDIDEILRRVIRSRSTIKAWGMPQ